MPRFALLVLIASCATPVAPTPRAANAVAPAPPRTEAEVEARVVDIAARRLAPRAWLDGAAGLIDIDYGSLAFVDGATPVEVLRCGAALDARTAALIDDLSSRLANPEASPLTCALDDAGDATCTLPGSMEGASELTLHFTPAGTLRSVVALDLVGSTEAWAEEQRAMRAAAMARLDLARCP